MEKEKAIIEWEIKHKEDDEKGNKFYIILFGVMIILLGFSVWQRNFLFGVFVILATGLVLFLSNQRPENVKFQLTDKEIIIGENESEYEYTKFTHFDIFEFNENDHELLLAFKEKYKPILRIRMYRGDIERVKDFLKTKLPNKLIEPSLLDFLTKIVGI